MANLLYYVIGLALVGMAALTAFIAITPSMRLYVG
jgi:hypothetical protein